MRTCILWRIIWILLLCQQISRSFQTEEYMETKYDVLSYLRYYALISKQSLCYQFPTVLFVLVNVYIYINIYIYIRWPSYNNLKWKENYNYPGREIWRCIRSCTWLLNHNHISSYTELIQVVYDRKRQKYDETQYAVIFTVCD